METNYAEGSKERDEIVRRLKLCRKQQGNQIDSTKGIEVDPFPRHWTNWTHTSEEMDDDEKELADFYNSIIISKRPYFFRYLYPNYNKKYNNYNHSYENYCQTNFGFSLEYALASSDKKFNKIKEKYFKYIPLLDSDCIMNNVCHYMEKNVSIIKHVSSYNSNKSLASILKSHHIEFDKNKYKKLYNLYKEYKSGKQNISRLYNKDSNEVFKTIDQYNKYIRNKAYFISNNMQELANLAVTICYEVHPSDSKHFAWGIFGEGIIQNIEENKQEVCYIPVKDTFGELNYLGKKYSMREIKIEEDIDGNYFG